MFLKRIPTHKKSHSLLFNQTLVVFGVQLLPPEISKSDISGALPGSDPSANMPYGYINNLIKIPRNLNGTGITIDPSNILFPDGNCGQLNLQRHNNIKTTIVIRGSIDFDWNQLNVPGVYPSSCTDSSYNALINTFITIWVPRLGDDLTLPLPNLTYGIIKKICCVGEKTIKQDSPPSPFVSPWLIYLLMCILINFLMT